MKPKLKPIERYVDEIAPKLGRMFPSPLWTQRLEAVISHAHWLPEGGGWSLVRSLRALAARANTYADRLEGAMNKDVKEELTFEAKIEEEGK